MMSVWATYLLLWTIVGLATFALTRALKEILQIHDEFSLTLHPPDLPTFFLPVMGSNMRLSNKDLLGKESILIFPRLPTSLALDPTTLRFLMGLVHRMRERYAESQIVIVSTGSKQEEPLIQLANLGHFKALTIISDPEGNIGQALKVNRTPAAFLFSKKGAQLKSGVVSGNESYA
jgi:hypothetical protein